MSFPYSSLYEPPAYASARQAVVDVHHFVLFQHGVLGYAGDFENVITDLFVHHDVSLHEAYEAAVARNEELLAKAQERAERGRRTREPSSVFTQPASARSTQGCCSSPAAPGQEASLSQPHHSSTPADTSPNGDGEAYLSAFTAANEARERQDQPTGTCDDDDAEAKAADVDRERHRKDRHEAQRRAARREEYKNNQFSLEWTYPFNKHGRLYQTGNLVCFAPGSNNFMGTGSGTLFCSRRMLAEFVPVFRAWLDMVEAARRAEDEAFRDDGHDDEENEGDISGTAWDASSGWFADESSSSFSSPFTDPYCRTLHSQQQQQQHRRPRHLPICFSCVGHSFGGLILREFLYLLTVDTIELPLHDASLYAAVLSLRLQMMRLHIRFTNFISVATPHCGTTECLWWPIYVGAWCLAKLRISPTYGELIVSDSEAVLMKRLVDPPHITALKLFRRRTLFANTHRDLLVGFGTSALIFETVPDDHTKAKGYWRSGDVPCASAFESDDAELSAAIYLAAHKESGDVGSTNRTTSLPSPEESHRRRPVDPLPPVSATHTLFDIWEFHHTRNTTTLAPVDPLAILAPDAAAAANALSESVAAAAAARKSTGQTNGGAAVGAAAAASMTTTSAPASQARADGETDGKADEDGDGAGAAGPWFYYERFFPEATEDAAKGAHAPNESPDAAGSGAGAGAAIRGMDPANPPPTLQFPLSQIISPEEMKEKLRVALSPSLSATVVTLSTGNTSASHSANKRNGARHVNDDSCRTDDVGQSKASSCIGTTTEAALMASGATTRNASTGSTWMWPSRSSLLSRLALGTNTTTLATAARRSPSPRPRAPEQGNGQVTTPSPQRQRSMGSAGMTRSVSRRGHRPTSAGRTELGPSTAAEPAVARRLDRHADSGSAPCSPHTPPIDDCPSSFLTIPARLLKACVSDVPHIAVKCAAATIQKAWHTLLTLSRPSCLFKLLWGALPQHSGEGSADRKRLSQHGVGGGDDLDEGHGVDAAPVVPTNEFEQREDESEEDYLRRLLLLHMRTLPQSRLTPRAIAHELRRDLDWRVRAVRWNHLIPIAHVASLGNWAWAGTSPNLVKAVAEEIGHIL